MTTRPTRRFLDEIGYLLPEGPAFQIETANVDPEIATGARPAAGGADHQRPLCAERRQCALGQPLRRLYGTDAMGCLPPPGGYDRGRGARVIARARVFLDEAFPIAGTSHADVRRYHVQGRRAAGRRPAAGGARRSSWATAGNPQGARTRCCCGTTGCMWSWSSTGRISSARAIRRCWPTCGWKAPSRRSWIARISVACVDAEDKVLAYRNWLGLMQGDLAEAVREGRPAGRRGGWRRTGTTPARTGSAVDAEGPGADVVRNVGHLMTNPAILDCRMARRCPRG